jgi:hypothetical protein
LPAFGNDQQKNCDEGIKRMTKDRIYVIILRIFKIQSGLKGYDLAIFVAERIYNDGKRTHQQMGTRSHHPKGD